MLRLLLSWQKHKQKEFSCAIQVKITTFRHVRFYLLFDVSSVTTLIVKKLLFTNISIKVDINITVTNKFNNKLKQYCYENKRLKH